MLNFRQTNRDGVISFIDGLLDRAQQEAYNAVIVEVVSLINRGHETNPATRLDPGAAHAVKRALQQYAIRVLAAKGLLINDSIVVLSADDWRLKLPETPPAEPEPPTETVLNKRELAKIIDEDLQPPKPKAVTNARSTS